jgi:hypothetical protein
MKSLMRSLPLTIVSIMRHAERDHASRHRSSARTAPSLIPMSAKRP